VEEGAVQGGGPAVGRQVEQIPEPARTCLVPVDRFETLAPVGHKVVLVAVGQLAAADLVSMS